jgi:hypothetical protein
MSPQFAPGIPDTDKTKEQLLAELQELRARNVALEGCETRVEQLESILKSGEEMSRRFLSRRYTGCRSTLAARSPSSTRWGRVSWGHRTPAI